MSLQEQFQVIQNRIRETALSCGKDPSSIQLVAVSKGRSCDEIHSLYKLGVRDFAENRVPEALEKIESLPSDIHWHFIGTIQSKKINKIIGKFELIHSVDSLELAEKLSQACMRSSIVQPILLQINISQEQQKHGMTPEFLFQNFEKFSSLPSLTIKGLMTMAPLMNEEVQEDKERVINTFRGLSDLKRKLQDTYLQAQNLDILSMGMSQDFVYAIQEGSTLVRIGSSLFSSANS